MGSHLVVAAPEPFDQDLRIASILEPLHCQAFVAELAVKALVQAILPGLSRIDRDGRDVRVVEPA